MKQCKRRRRGITMVETVVAMTVIVIISIAALTAISATANVNACDQASFQARTDARNALEVFRYASNADDFQKNMTFQFKPETPSADKTTYTVDYGWCNLTVTADFVQSRFTARAVNNKGDVLFEVNNYEK